MMPTDVVFGDGSSAREARVVMPCSSLSFCAQAKRSALDYPFFVLKKNANANVLGELALLACFSPGTTAKPWYHISFRLSTPRRPQTGLK